MTPATPPHCAAAFLVDAHANHIPQSEQALSVREFNASSHCTPVVQSTAPAARLKELRAAALAAGRCYVCRCRPIKPGRRSCQECLDRVAEHQKNNRGVLCCKCSQRLRGKRRGKRMCAPCAAKHSIKGTARFVARANAGTCGRCGQAPCVSGRSQCFRCLEDMRDRALYASRVGGSKPKRNSCSICTAMGVPSMNHDRRTHDRYMARAQAWAPTTFPTSPTVRPAHPGLRPPRAESRSGTLSRGDR